MNIDPLADAQFNYSPYHYVYNNPILYNDPTGMIGERAIGWATKVINEDDPSQVIDIDDGYDFEFYVSSEVFNIIKEKGSIKGTGAYYRWYIKALGYEMKKTDGSASDEVSSFLLNDAIGDVLVAVSEKDISGGVYNIAASKLKKLKKLKKWIKKNKGKIPGTKKGDVEFKNREGKLPKTDADGKPITYKEYDINPAPPKGQTRGTERMVKGSDGKVYYTDDHYKTFTEIED